MIRKSPRRRQQHATKKDKVIRALLTPVYYVLYPFIVLITNKKRGCKKPKNHPVLYAFMKLLSIPMDYIHKARIRRMEKKKKPIHNCNTSQTSKDTDFVNIFLNVLGVVTIITISSLTCIFCVDDNINVVSSETCVITTPVSSTTVFSTTAVKTATTTICTTTCTTASNAEKHVFSEYELYLLCSFVEQEMGSEDYSDIYLVDNDFNLFATSVDYAQQCVAKSLINQMHMIGSDSISEALSDEVQYGSSLEKFSSGERPLYTFNKQILENVYKVITNNTEYIPDNLYYERCTEEAYEGDTTEYTSDISTAYQFMQARYDREVDVYLFGVNNDGTWWMACTLPE